MLQNLTSSSETKIIFVLTKTAIKADKYWELEKAGTGLSIPAGRDAEQHRHLGNQSSGKKQPTSQPTNLSTNRKPINQTTNKA